MIHKTVTKKKQEFVLNLLECPCAHIGHTKQALYIRTNKQRFIFKKFVQNSVSHHAGVTGAVAECWPAS